jgi:hypothetical protein
VAEGILQIHSAPPALREHIEWAVGGIVALQGDWLWAAQPAAPGQVRAEIAFVAQPGASALVASALARFGQLRFEVSEERSPGADGARYSCTPSLGLLAASVSANGDIVVPEQRLKSALGATARDGSLRGEIRRLLGEDWDGELEPFRCAAGGFLAAAG